MNKTWAPSLQVSPVGRRDKHLWQRIGTLNAERIGGSTFKYGDDTEERVTQSGEYGRAPWRKEAWDYFLKTAKEFPRRSQLERLDSHMEYMFCVKMLTGGVLGAARDYEVRRDKALARLWVKVFRY